MRIHFYGRLSDLLGRNIDLDVPKACSIAELRKQLAIDYPHAATVLAGRTRACIGDTVVPDSQIVGPGDDVEFFPPVSGG